MWKALDPERNCYITHETLYDYFKREMDIEKEVARALVEQDIDVDGDGTITFKEFNKFFKLLIDS